MPKPQMGLRQSTHLPEFIACIACIPPPTQDPMDFQTIMARLKAGGWYLNLEMLVADVVKIFRNCR